MLPKDEDCKPVEKALRESHAEQTDFAADAILFRPFGPLAYGCTLAASLMQNKQMQSSKSSTAALTEVMLWLG